MSDLTIARMRKGVALLQAKGFRLLRVHANDKRPFDVGWPDLATDDIDVVDTWFDKAVYNVGVACGPQPNGLNLVVIDVDARHGGLDRWASLLDINGQPDTAMHATPSGGLHVFFNASLPINNTGNLGAGIDVRGIGGQVVVPPSTRIIDGALLAYEPVGPRGLWCYDVAPMPDWLLALLRPIERSIERHPSVPRTSPTGVVENADWLRDHWDWLGVLEAAGYEIVRQQGDRIFLRHPTATSEWSCTVDLAEGRMNAYSTNMPSALRDAQINRDGSVSWSPYDWFVATEHDGNYSRATSEINRRREPLGGGSRRARAADPAAPDQDLTGDGASLNLPADFWERRPVLAQIRDAAWSAGCSPDALLVQALARVATYVHPSFKLPGVEQGLIGKPQTLDFLGCVVAETSGGKTLAAGVGELLVPAPEPPAIGDPLIDFEQKVGSGEGIAEFFLVPEMKPDSEGKLVKTNKRVIGKQALFMNVDEGTGFTQQAGRKGTTIIATLASAWSGESLGQLNAAEETRRLVQGGRVRICAVINMQDSNGYKLYSDELESVGFTGRLMFASAHDPAAPPPGSEPAWPGRLNWDIKGGSTMGVTYLTYAGEIVAEIKATRHGILTKAVQIDRRQSQYLLLRCKVAALFAILDGRLHVSVDDWSLATEAINMSAATLSHLDSVRASQVEVTAVTAASFKMKVAESAEETHLRRLAIGWKPRVIEELRTKGPLPWKGLKGLVRSDRRAMFRTIIDEMVSEGVLRLDGGTYKVV